MLIGITGTIGSGKSLVARLLGEMLPAPVHSSDEISRKLLERGEAGYLKLVETWGRRYLLENGEVDRALLRTAIFDDHRVRTQLEAILHPLVRLELLQAKTGCNPTAPQIAEVPLLFECGWQADFDCIVCVTADPGVAIQRVVDRDSVNQAEVEKIISTQMDPALKKERSDFHIDNSGSHDQTLKQVNKLAVSLRALLVMDKSK